METSSILLITSGVFIVILLTLLVILFLQYTKAKDSLKQILPMTSTMDINTKNSEMKIVDDAIRKALIKAYQFFINRSINFSNESPNKLYLAGKYRDLIRYLLRPEMTIEWYDKDDSVSNISFFKYFVQKVYLIYISETSEAIKSLLFKYHSGFDVVTYTSDNENPTAIPYIIDFINNDLWLRFDNIEAVENKYLEQLNLSSGEPEEYKKWLADYDKVKVREICLNIYNTRDSDYLVNETKVTELNNTETKQGGKNEFSFNFNEQSE